MSLKFRTTSPSNNNASKCNAFSLAEVLVVLSIIGVIAGILLPVMVSAKEAGKRADALEELSQIGGAIQLYENDHDEMLPNASGNNCFHLAVDLHKFCQSFDPEFIRGTTPINSVIHSYLPSWEVYRSGADRMAPALLAEGGHKQTWFEETTTHQFPGSSVEYTTLGLELTLYTSVS